VESGTVKLKSMMLYKDNIKCVKNNKMCEINNEAERMKSQELMTLGGTLVVLGIIFSEDRLIGYSFIGIGILLSAVSVFKSRRKEEGSLVEMR
jgi:hypothetical protein